jgi:wobble nucleotide-excising tRNase
VKKSNRKLWGEIRWYGFMNKWASQKHFTANNQSLVVTSAAEIRWYGFMNKWASQKHFTANNQSLVVTSAAAIALTTMSWFFRSIVHFNFRETSKEARPND